MQAGEVVGRFFKGEKTDRKSCSLSHFHNLFDNHVSLSLERAKLLDTVVDLDHVLEQAQRPS